MADCPPAESLERLLAETLSGHERTLIEAHVEGCGDCQNALNSLTRGTVEPVLLSAQPDPTANDSQTEAFFQRLKRMRPPTGGDAPGQSLQAMETQGELPKVEGYEVIDEIGRGAAGVVYRARHCKLNRLVALKMIAAGPQLSLAMRQRFRAEAMAIARLKHVNIVQVYDVGEHGEFPYLSLELISGGNLADWMAGKPRPAFEAAQIVATLAEAVEYAHRQGVVHRDLKPSNVLLGEVQDHPGKSELKITDFGIAKVLPQAGFSGSQMTQAGEILGTPSYMAPEQARGNANEITAATDVYSIGVILYELLTGRPPFQGATSLDTLMLAARRDPVSIRMLVHRVPRDLDTICLKCLEKEAARRYPTAGALAEDVGRFLRNEPILARPLSWVGHSLRWTRRHTGVAVSLAGVALSLILVAVVSLVAMAHFRTLSVEKGKLAGEKEIERGKAVDARQLAEKNARLAEKHRQRAEDKGREVLQNHYFYGMNLGGQAATLPGAIGRVLEFLAPWTHEQVDLRNWEWYYLKSLCHRDIRTMSGRTNGVLCAAWSPDGRRVASGDFDNIIRIWDPDLGREIRSFSSHTFEVTSVAWSPDGHQLAAATGSGTVKIWNPDTGEAMCSFRNGDQAVFAAAWSPNGKLVASGGRDHTIRIWNPQDGKVQRAFDSGSTRSIRDLAWSPDGKRLASGDEGGDVQLWDPVTGENIRRVHGHANFVTRVAWSPDGTRLASSSNDNTVKIWDADIGAEKLKFQGHAMGVMSVAWSPDSTRLATASEDQTLKVWVAADGAELFTLRGHVFPMTSVGWSPDGARLASGSWDQTVKIWNASAGPEVPVLVGHTGFVFDLSWSPDGRRLASSSGDGTIRIWDAGAKTEQAVLRGHTELVRSVSWSPNGTRIASAGNDHTIRLWDPSNGRQLNPIRGDADELSCVAWSPDNLRLASSDSNQIIHIWDAVAGRELQTCIGHESGVSTVAWSPDGQRLASGGSADRSVRVWDSTTGKEVFSVKAHGAGVKRVAWSPDGLRLASASEDQTIITWDATTGRVLTTLRGHTAQVNFVAWSRDGTRLASASDDRTVKLWDSVTGRETLSFSHASMMKAVAWSPDEMALAVAGDEGVVRIYDASAGYLAERAPQYLQTLDRRLSIDRKNAKDWLLRAEINSRRDNWEEAATDAQNYLALNVDQRWLALGYWVVGPYPENLDTSFSPEKDQDFGHAALGTGGDESPEFLSWQVTPVKNPGVVDFGEFFHHATHISAYAQLRVYSPRQQQVAVLLGSAHPMKLWLNGKKTSESALERRAVADSDAVLATLTPGWNTLLARVANVTGEHTLYMRISDAKTDMKRPIDATAK